MPSYVFQDGRAANIKQRKKNKQVFFQILPINLTMIGMQIIKTKISGGSFYKGSPQHGLIII